MRYLDAPPRADNDGACRAMTPPSQNTEIIQLLSSTRFFGGLQPMYLRRIAEIGREESFLGGQVIFQEGDPGEKFYLIIEGAVRISRMVPGMGEEALAVLRP